EAAAAVLHVPLIGGGFGGGAGGVRAEADLQHAHAVRADAGEALDGPRQLVVQAGLAEGRDFAAEALDDADLIRLDGIETAKHDERGRGDEPRLDELAAALGGPGQ